MEQWIDQALLWVGSFNLKIALIVFFISLVGEAFVISIPILFESIFLLAGINFGLGILPAGDLILLMLTSQLGRQAGALILFGLSRKSTNLFWRLIERRFPQKNPIESTPLRFLRKLDSISPFGVALGRLLWLRIPLTLILGARRKLKTLVLGIAISSTIYEAVYVGLGAIVGRTVDVDSPLVFILSAASLGVVYLIAFLVRLIIKRMKKSHKDKDESSDPAEAAK
jgi:membrane-associated protein